MNSNCVKQIVDWSTNCIIQAAASVSHSDYTELRCEYTWEFTGT